MCVVDRLTNLRKRDVVEVIAADLLSDVRFIDRPRIHDCGIPQAVTPIVCATGMLQCRSQKLLVIIQQWLIDLLFFVFALPPLSVDDEHTNGQRETHDRDEVTEQLPFLEGCHAQPTSRH